MDSPLLPRTTQSSSAAAAGNLFDESVESKFDDLTFDESPPSPVARPSFLPPPRATNKPRFSLFAPGATARDPSPPSAPSLLAASQSSYRTTAQEDASVALSAALPSSSTRSPIPSHATSSSSAGPPPSSSSPANTPQHSTTRAHEELLTVSQLGCGVSNGFSDGAEDNQQPVQLDDIDDDESADATLRRTLYELQGFNKLFDKLLSARQGVNTVHERALAQTQTTNALLDNYIATLRDENRTISLMRNPGWTGAKDDAIHMQTLMATLEREREELRQQTLRMEEAARLAREQAERGRAAAAEEAAARRREGGGIGRGGGADRGRGVARGSLRGSRGRGGPGLGSSIPTPAATTARGKTPSYASVKSSGYGPPKKRAE